MPLPLRRLKHCTVLCASCLPPPVKGAVGERNHARGRLALGVQFLGIGYPQAHAEAHYHAARESPFVLPPGKNGEHVKQTSDLHHQWRPILKGLGIRYRPRITAATPMRQYAQCLVSTPHLSPNSSGKACRCSYRLMRAGLTRLTTGRSWISSNLVRSCEEAT